MAYSFNGVSRVITITNQTVMSVRDVYSRWADWMAQSDNAKYLPAFNPVGGQAIDAANGTSIPIYAFLQNGWKIKPQESNHTLSVNDGVLLVDGGGDPFVNPTGSFVVRINYQQPVQAITVSTGGTAGANPWDQVIEGGYTAADLVRIMSAALAGKVSGAGTATETFRSITDDRNAIIASVDANGNRTAIAINPS
jgi:hypothetical protein